MIKYVTDYSKDNIEEVEVLRETEKCVFVSSGAKNDSERRMNKSSDWARYHDTWDKAYDYLVSCANSNVEYKERQFKNACDNRVKVEALKATKKGE